MPSMIVKTLPIEQISQDPYTQTRETISHDVAAEYAEAMKAGATFPPVTVFQLPGGKSYWLADGFTRMLAFKMLGATEVMAQIHVGSKADAFRFALAANATHGQRRTQADIARAIRLTYERRADLGLPDQPSARSIAALVDCDHKTAAKHIAAHDIEWRSSTERVSTAGQRFVVNAPPPPLTPSTAPTAPGTPTGDGPKDANGDPIPPEALAAWNRRPEVEALIRTLMGLRTKIDQAMKDSHPLFVGIGNTGRPPLNHQAIKAHLSNALTVLKAAYPDYVCPYCHGIAGCRACAGVGALSYYRWKNTVPLSMQTPASKE